MQLVFIPAGCNRIPIRASEISGTQKRKNPLSRVFEKSRVVTLNLNWCPEEDSNFHDLAVTST